MSLFEGTSFWWFSRGTKRKTIIFGGLPVLSDMVHKTPRPLNRPSFGFMFNPNRGPKERHTRIRLPLGGHIMLIMIIIVVMTGTGGSHPFPA